MGVARAWSRWPTEIFSPSLMHTVNDYLSDVGSKKAVSFMVLEKNVPVVDRDVARYFYEVNNYYGMFENDFNRQTAAVGRLLDKR